MLHTPQIDGDGRPDDRVDPPAHPREEIQLAMGPGIREVFAVLAAQGIAPAGPWFTHHRRRPTDTSTSTSASRSRRRWPPRAASSPACSRPRESPGPSTGPLRGARGRLGRVLRLDGIERTHAAGGPLGAIRRRPGDGMRPGRESYGTQPPAARLTDRAAAVWGRRDEKLGSTLLSVHPDSVPPFVPTYEGQESFAQGRKGAQRAQRKQQWLIPSILSSSSRSRFRRFLSAISASPLRLCAKLFDFRTL